MFPWYVYDKWINFKPDTESFYKRDLVKWNSVDGRWFTYVFLIDKMLI